MPTIFFYGPKLEKDKKKELIKSFTESASRATGLPEQAFVIYLREADKENVGVGGELLSEKTR
ncbi:4-oxalocrotonate tautomerase DmpI [Dethiobacter alkaliphilus]|uniref:4-oxalocrotonate tautomerase DmpI n=1 Tax=Dethiobacter alkaliphilus TaxID=427926 RepID=UPI0022268E48|nr:4-oxalocrotonate tautomerase DmpI [Dethiobacter alkaliphilus]MCW3489574.1 tautomerase family protein [Dethiobacter alkaliphilus]